jgi:hypothetical protein
LIKRNLTVFASIFRGEKFIDGYLNNLKNQTIFNQINCIFVHAAFEDDISTQNKIKEFCLKYKNAKSINFKKDPGLYQCWNIAIKEATTEFVTNWNIDDRKPDFGLEILYKEISKDKSLDLIYGYTYISNIPNEKYIENSYEKIYPCLPHSFHNLLMNNSPHCMPMWRKDLHERFGFFDEKYESAADGDMWLKACANGAKMKMLNHPIGLYYDNPDGKSTNKENLNRMIEEVTQMRRKYLKLL